VGVGPEVLAAQIQEGLHPPTISRPVGSAEVSTGAAERSSSGRSNSTLVLLELTP